MSKRTNTRTVTIQANTPTLLLTRNPYRLNWTLKNNSQTASFYYAERSNVATSGASQGAEVATLQPVSSPTLERWTDPVYAISGSSITITVTEVIEDSYPQEKIEPVPQLKILDPFMGLAR